MEKNIRYSYQYSFLQFFGITSLWVLYLAQKGFSALEIGVMEGIFHVTSFLFEVPSGGLADRIGYKKMLVMGRIASIISCLLLIPTNNFYLACLSFVFSALSYNCATGTSESLVFESLKGLGREKEYLKVNANLNALIEIAQGSGVVVAGLLSHWFFDGTYWIQIFLSLFAIWIISRMVETPRPLVVKVSYIQQLRQAARTLQHLPGLLRLMLSFALLDAVNATYYFYFQNYFARLGIAGWGISLLVVISLVFQVAGAKLAPWIGGRFAIRHVFIGVVVAVSIGIGAASFLPRFFVLVCYIMVNALQALTYPINSDAINQRIPSAARATLNSVDSLCYSLVMIPLFPLTGWLIDVVDYQVTFSLLAAFIFIVGLASSRKLTA